MPSKGSSNLKLPRRQPSFPDDASREDDAESAAENNISSPLEVLDEALGGSASSLDCAAVAAKTEEKGYQQTGDKAVKNSNLPSKPSKGSRKEGDDSTGPTYEDDQTNDDDEQDGDGRHDDDATYVTSNQNKSGTDLDLQGSKRLASSSASVNSINKIERWKAGDKPSLRSSSSSSKRRSKNPFKENLNKQSFAEPGMVISFQNEGDSSHATETIPSLNTPHGLTKEQVESFLFEYYKEFDAIFGQTNASEEQWDAFLQRFFTKEAAWVRSTGMPLDREGFKKVMIEEVVGQRATLVSIDSIDIMARNMVAVVVFTVDQYYEYKGEQQNDRFVVTTVLNLVHGGDILIGHEHSCVGKPIPRDTRWK